MKINVIITSFSPLLDKYGKPSVNPDGTFYPNDKFSIAYNAYVAENVVFSGVEAAYNKSSFSMFNSTNWGTEEGSGSFEVSSSAALGTYDFNVSAWGSTLFNLGNESSGSVTVTYGGVDVDAYYSTQYLLDVGVNNAGEGTTNLGSGQYWQSAGASVTVTAQPSNGYVFAYWLLDWSNASSSSTITVLMNSYHAIQACFRQAGNTTANNSAYPNITSLNTMANQVSSSAPQETSAAVSSVTFTAHGLGTDASGAVLQLDGENQVNAGQLPTVLNWNVSSTHTYNWSETVGSSNIGQRYVLDQVTVNENYVSTVVVQVTVVAYDPHFTVALAYPVPNSEGETSYEKPFALIIRYDGNGPDYNLGERAVIEGFSWDGYASKMAGVENMEQTLTPNITLADVFNQTSSVEFSTIGIDSETDKPILTVDGENFGSGDLPKTFNWAVDSNHTFAWAQTLPVMTLGFLGNYPIKVESSDEWLEWQFSLAFPPSADQMNITQMSEALNQTDLENQLVQQFNTPNGTLKTSPLGNTVTAVYAHNKLLSAFAQEAEVSQEQALECLNSYPIYFDNESRYAKMEFSLNPAVTKQTIAENYTTSINYNVTLENSMFGQPNNYQVNYTCHYKFYTKQVNITAYKWSPTTGNWSIDEATKLQATFGSALNFTENDALISDFENQTSDEEALNLAAEDLSNCATQTFTGTGTAVGVLNMTSPLYYDLNITAGQKGRSAISLQKTVQISFLDNQTYDVPVNLDASSPLQVNVTDDDIQSSILTLNAPTELGGLTNVSIYVITSAPAGYTLGDLPINQADLKLLKTVNLTLPQTQVVMPTDYQQNYQLYQYYEGYSTIYEGTLGFSGQTQISITKDPSITKLPSYNATLLYVEAQNVWGTKFHAIVAVQPYSIPHWEVLLDQLALYLFILIAVAIILSLAVYIIKGRS